MLSPSQQTTSPLNKVKHVRPRRNFSKDVASFLLDWLISHKDNPYPTVSEK